MDDKQLEVSPSIQTAIKQIGNYSEVTCVKGVSTEPPTIIVETKWAVKLPNMFRKQGISDTGVREVETVYWRIPWNYPQNAPSPRLRRDFPTNHPHINPYTQGEMIYPCISESPLEDMLHSMGLPALFDAMCQWLNNAAADELHCPVQGWEHMRRDDIKGQIYVDTHAIRADLDKSTQIVKFYNYRYSLSDSYNWLIGGLITPSLGSSHNVFKKRDIMINANTKIRHAPSVLFRTKDRKVFDKYMPETVHDFKSLRAFSKYLGLQDAFDPRIKYILTVSGPPEEFLVVFAVKRPFYLIGTESSWELLAYRVCFKQDHKGNIPDDTVVQPTQLIERCCPQLLQVVSGEKVDKPIRLSLLGCGSLGSKVALHLAKTGCYQFELVDKDYFSSHNNARHGLIVSDFNHLCFSKSQLLHEQLLSLNVASKPIDKDIRFIGNKGVFSLNKKTDYILDTTASMLVRYYLSHHCKLLSGRLIQSTLYGKATMGVVAIEGDSRSVRIDDIASFVNTLCIKNERVKKAMYSGNGPQLNHFGEGCSSVTTIMNDIDISLMSAAVSSRINTHMKHSNTTTNGILYVGTIDQKSLGMEWITYEFLPTLVMPKDSHYDWEVRVLGKVSKKIKELSNKYSMLENGGVIAGQICHLSKTIYVNYLLEAPKGSVRTRNSFELNLVGLAKEFERIHSRTNDQIKFLGTWHSHTSATPPSNTDKNSLKKLQVNYDLPIVMLACIGGHIVRVKC